MLHECPDAAVIRLQKAACGTRLSPFQSADTEGFFSPSVTMHSHGTALAVGLHTCKLLLMVSFICASPNLTNSPHWKPSATPFQHFQFYFSHDFSPFSPTHQAKHPVSFPHQYVLHRQEKGMLLILRHCSPVQSMSATGREKWGGKLVSLLCSWAAACQPGHVLSRFAAARYSAPQQRLIRLAGAMPGSPEKKKKGKRYLFITGLWDGKVVSIFNRKCSQRINPGSIGFGDLMSSIWALSTIITIFPGPILHRVESSSIIVYWLERG